MAIVRTQNVKKVYKMGEIELEALKMLDVLDRVVWLTDGRIERILNREDLKIEVGTIDGKTE